MSHPINIIADTSAKAEDKALKRKRVTSLAGVFSRALSVLTARKIQVHVVDTPSQNAPAWSSTHEVWLNLAEIKDDFTARSITSLNGLSFHELGHLRYTPRNGSPIIQKIRASEEARNLWSAFNCLEDSRIENLLIAYLPSIKSWITATIADYLLDNPDELNRAFPLIYGRYYLPKDIRQQVMDSYMKPDDIAELKSIIDEYTAVIHEPDNADHVFYLVSRFAELVSNLPPMPPKEPKEGDIYGCYPIFLPNPHGHNDRPTDGYESSSNRPSKKSDQQRDMDKVLSGRDTDLTPTPKEDKPKENTQSQNVQGDVQDDMSDDFDSDFDSYDYDDFDSDFDDSDSDSKPKDNSGGGAGSQERTNADLPNALNDLIQEAIKELSKDINQIAKQLGINDLLDGGNATTPRKAKFNDVAVPPMLSDISRAFSRELENIKTQYDPMWIRNQDNGKVNPLRYLRGDDFDTIFDEWQEGRDDVTDIEAVILLDSSGSMNGSNADNAYASMWAIKKALERVNARTTVVTFDTGAELLYGADEQAGTTIRHAGTGGGTDPENALLYAKRVLAETDKPIRILFMITDGQWNTDEGEASVEQMRSAGVITCQAIIADFYDNTIPTKYLEENRHKFELLAGIKSAKDILSLGKDIVRLSINRNLVAGA